MPRLTSWRRVPSSWPSAPSGLALPWQAMALASIVVPWLLYPFAGGDVADALTANALFDALWPFLMGAALAFALRRWGSRLPPIPAGDIAGAAERAFRASYVVGAASERADGQL